MISVVIPTYNAEQGLPLSLNALVPGVVNGVVRDVTIVDGGSSDQTLAIAEQAGAVIVKSPPGRGLQLARGAAQARGAWLLFLHADTVLEPGWDEEVRVFIEKVESGRRKPCAAAFQFALDDDGLAPRILEKMVGLRSNVLSAPYGDQGLLISRTMHDEIGGFRSIECMEDLDIVRRLGRKRLSMLRSRGITSAARYRAHGYLARIARNQMCLAMYRLGFSPAKIARMYKGRLSK